MEIFSWLPKEGSQILFVLFLSFLIGLEREESKANDDHFAFGGVRTYPLIGMIGYALSVLSDMTLIPFLVGLCVVALFLLLAYSHKVKKSGHAGVTSEMSALTTYLIGGLIQHNLLWVATTLVVATILLLSLKQFLEGLAKKIESDDILTFTKFLLLSAVILPLLPNQALTQFQINPLKVWLIVVAVSSVSYASYVLQKLGKNASGILWSAIFGGIYSSTVTTIVLARRSQTENRPHLFFGGILIASGIMYLRLTILLALFNQDLLKQVGLSFLCLAAIAIAFGFLWSKRGDGVDVNLGDIAAVKNPLEFNTALIFSILFVGMLIATQYAVHFFGDSGLYTLAGVMGLTDIDPFVMSLTQNTPSLSPVAIAANALLISAASNNVMKGVYAYFLSSKNSRLQSCLCLIALAGLGIIPIFLFH
ncbi:uncharacterized membrane protein (DUF4010 family) [Polynucleobacter sphagniphilus]|uniref:MgtC/SapB family protein n=1 Tax=Polynucleobacter sphagniphilus TaxID=1743169 RepID=UPI002473450E|nr:MgtC/SapB family protein [Polynucleobacter sphagniphilus]MDH6301317.1 uncharacterized membrane protein (DUF4010 family) [Polynucleobacter sphagniphilus]